MSQPTYFNLGHYKRQVTTSSTEAQMWFDRGLIWTYAYNHEEAESCFDKAANADSDCAMAYWGLAYAIGPNYNKPWEAFEDDEKPDALSKAHGALEKAMALKDQATPSEQGLIEALSLRYPSDANIQDFSSYNDAYANAMRQAYQASDEDLDLCALFVEALMNKTPWKLWALDTGKPAEGADTEEAMNVMNKAFDESTDAWKHPGLLGNIKMSLHGMAQLLLQTRSL